MGRQKIINGAVFFYLMVILYTLYWLINTTSIDHSSKMMVLTFSIVGYLIVSIYLCPDRNSNNYNYDYKDRINERYTKISDFISYKKLFSVWWWIIYIISNIHIWFDKNLTIYEKRNNSR
jgi:hypothetical protein